ncbi:MAG: T9SS type A sorting domain-containing protein [Saprospiraceae bacterium]
MKYTSILFFCLFTIIKSFSACELYDLTVSQSDCNKEKKFSLTINFKYKDVSECFTIKGNGKIYGTFKYNQLPITLNNLSGDCKTPYEFIIRDCKNEACKLEYILGLVCCEVSCELSNLKIEKTKCDSNQQFCAIINFNHTGNSSCFKLFGNGKEYGKFSYSQLPLKICGLKGDCETEYEFEVKDCENPECSTSGQLGIVCCEKICKLYDLKTEKTECNEQGLFYVYLNFKYNDTSKCFIVNVNGKKYGVYNYYQLPIKLGPFEGNCKTNYEFTVIDCENEKCQVSKNLGIVCCETKTCKLSELKITKSDCDKSNNFFVFINFKYTGTSTCFKLRGNGKTYGTFNYSQLPLKIGPLKGDCKTQYEFLITDCENETCKISKNIGKVCCEFKKDNEKELSAIKNINGLSQYESVKTEYSIQNIGYDLIQNQKTIIVRFHEPALSSLQYSMYNLVGNEFKNTYINQHENILEIKTENLAAGIYILKVKLNSQAQLIKFLIE